MSDFFWKKLNLITGWVVLLALFSLLVFMANMEIKDLDLWLHIGMGRYIVSHGFHVPSHDILSCTIAGKPWVNHEWLFQVIVYWIFTNWGADGLINMQIGLVAFTMGILLLLGYNREKQLGSIFSLLLVSLVYQTRFTIRPDLFSLLFFALYILLLSFYMDRKWAVVVLFIIQVFWSNIHGFFFFGPLFVLIALGAEWLKRHAPLPYEWNRVARLTDEEYRRLKWILLAVVLACLVNPLTFKGAWYPISVFFKISGEHKIFFDKIIELKRPLAWNTLFDTTNYPFYKLLIILSFASFVYNRRKLDIAILIFWLVFLFFSLAAVRNLIFFAFAAYLVFVTNALSISLRDVFPLRLTDRTFGYLLSIVLKIFLIVWIIEYGAETSLNGYFDFDTYERKSEFGGISQRSYPNKAVDFLIENNVEGNFFNDFNSGAYLIGRCYPKIKVFIDGRTEVYGPKFFKYYQSLWENDDADVFAEMLEKYQITGALMNSVQQPIPKNALGYLYKSKEWVPVYFDYDAVIFLKDVSQNKEVIAKHRLDLTKWQAPPVDLLRLGSMKATPYLHVNRAYTLESIDLDEPALTEVREILKVAPNYAEPFKLMGRIYAKKKDFRKAFENFRIAVVMMPEDRQLRHNLALSYYDLGEYKYAVEQFQRIINAWPTHPKAYFYLAKTFIKMEKYDDAMMRIKKGFSLDHSSVKDMATLGEMLVAAGQMDKAKEILELGLTADDDAEGREELHRQMGEWYRQKGDVPHAREQFEKALKLKPGSKEIRKQLDELGPVSK